MHRAGENHSMAFRVDGHEACNETLPVKGSAKRMPTRGFITCCDMSVPQAEMVESIKNYFDKGGRLVDTAPGFGYERAVGKAIEESRLPRDKLWLSTKIDT